MPIDRLIPYLQKLAEKPYWRASQLPKDINRDVLNELDGLRLVEVCLWAKRDIGDRALSKPQPIHWCGRNGWYVAGDHTFTAGSINKILDHPDYQGDCEPGFRVSPKGADWIQGTGSPEKDNELDPATHAWVRDTFRGSFRAGQTAVSAEQRSVGGLHLASQDVNAGSVAHAHRTNPVSCPAGRCTTPRILSRTPHALALLLEEPEITPTKLAERVGVTRSTLYKKSDKWKHVRQTLKAREKQNIPKGSKHSDDTIEAEAEYREMHPTAGED